MNISYTSLASNASNASNISNTTYIAKFTPEEVGMTLGVFLLIGIVFICFCMKKVSRGKYRSVSS